MPQAAAQAELALDGRDQLDGPLVPQLASSDEVTDDEYKSFVVVTAQPLW